MELAALERFLSPGKGSGLRSRRRVRPGELLYRAEPFAYVVTKEQLGGVCEQCFQRYERARERASAIVRCPALWRRDGGVACVRVACVGTAYGGGTWAGVRGGCA